MCVIYDQNLKRIADQVSKYNLEIQDKFIEFDAEDYWNCIKNNLKILIAK